MVASLSDSLYGHELIAFMKSMRYFSTKFCYLAGAELPERGEGGKSSRPNHPIGPHMQ